MSETPQNTPPTLRESIGALFHAVRTLGPGAMAELRRYRQGHGPAPLAFYRVAALAGAQSAPSQEERWATVACCAAILDGQTQGQRLGDALAQSGFSELRLSRLLRAPVERLHEDLPSLARFLHQKGVPADFTEAALLILQPDEDRPRQAIARDYFRSLHLNSN